MQDKTIRKSKVSFSIRRPLVVTAAGPRTGSEIASFLKNIFWTSITVL